MTLSPAGPTDRSVLQRIRHPWRVTTEGLDLLPAGGAIVACARRGPFDHLNIVASLQRPAVAVAPRARTWPGRFVAARGCVPEAGPHLKAVLERGELLVMFPEGVMADDGAVHRGHPEIAALAVAARVPIVPAAWVSGTTRADARTRGRVLRLGEPLCFNRFWQDEIPSDALDGFILRAITDHVMAAITDLAGRPYADTYSDAVDDTPDVIERAEEARQRLAERRAAEQEWEAAEAELARELDERDQAELAEAAEAARLHAERAAAADERSRLRRRIALGLPPDEGEES